MLSTAKTETVLREVQELKHTQLQFTRHKNIHLTTHRHTHTNTHNPHANIQAHTQHARTHTHTHTYTQVGKTRKSENRRREHRIQRLSVRFARGL